MAVLIFLAMASGAFASAAVQADPREQVTTAVSYGVRLLEEGAYSRFLTEFVSPKERHAIAFVKIGKYWYIKN